MRTKIVSVGLATALLTGLVGCSSGTSDPTPKFTGTAGGSSQSGGHRSSSAGVKAPAASAGSGEADSGEPDSGAPSGAGADHEPGAAAFCDKITDLAGAGNPDSIDRAAIARLHSLEASAPKSIAGDLHTLVELAEKAGDNPENLSPADQTKIGLAAQHMGEWFSNNCVSS